jgi:hypothetical protein
MLHVDDERAGRPQTRPAALGRWTRRAGAVAISAALVATLPVAVAGAADEQSAQRPAATAMMTRVTLGILECVTTEDWSGGDEPYIKVNGRTVWTSADSVNDGESIAVNRIVNSGDTVALYDADSPDADDFLGSDIVEGDRGTLVFGNDDALYYLHYGPA